MRLSGGVMIFVLLLALAAFVLFIVALVGIARSARLSDLARAVWVLIVLVFPVLGPVVWFIIGQHSEHSGVEAPRRSA